MILLPACQLLDQCDADIHREMRLCCDAAINSCSCASQNMKRKVWEASWSSIKSKKVKGSHHVDCDMVSGGSLPDDSNQQTFIEYDHGCLKCSRDEAAFKVLSENTSNIYHEEKHGDDKLGTNDHLHPTKPILRQTPVIMLMNIADDMKKAGLIKVIISFYIYLDENMINDLHGKDFTLLDFDSLATFGSVNLKNLLVGLD